MTALPSLPLDEAVAIRDNVWFDSEMLEQASSRDASLCRPISLLNYLKRLAESYLDRQGRPKDETKLEGGCAGPEARLRWSWMCQALPPDLLRVARGVTDPSSDPFPLSPIVQKMLQDRGFAEMDLNLDLLLLSPHEEGQAAVPSSDPFPLSPIVQKMLQDRGFAETHLHLGAALDFSLAWAALMRALASNESKHSDFQSAGGCFDQGRDLCSWLLHVAVTRIVLAEWLFDNSSYGSSQNELLEFAFDHWNRRGYSTDAASDVLRSSCEERYSGVLDFVERARLATLFIEVKRGRWCQVPDARACVKQHPIRRFARVRALYNRLIRPPHLALKSDAAKLAFKKSHKVEERHDVFASDPLATIVGWQPTASNSPETLFIEAALRRIQSEEKRGENDSDFARLFWQVMRVRCLLYRHVVQRPLTPGLQWFVRFFSRIKPLRLKTPSRALIRTAAHLSGENMGLRSLEVRLGTDQSESVCLEYIRDIGRAAIPLEKK